MGNNASSIQNSYRASKLSNGDKKTILGGIWNKYVNVANGPKGQFNYPTGREGLEYQKYDTKLLEEFPEEVLSLFCGVGNPFIIGPVKPGFKVLDIGCGAGVDTLLAAKAAGAQGHATGIDVTTKMLDRAKENQKICKVSNATFLEGSAESLPLPDNSFDLVISNGVFNMVVDKALALKEILRVLKPTARLQVADQLRVGQMPTEVEEMVTSWGR